MRYFLAFAVLFATTPPVFANELDDLAAAIDRAPDDAKTYDAYAMACIKQGKLDDAIRRLKIGVARIPNYTEGYYKLAYAYRKKLEWADAADYYRRYIAVNPSRTDPYFGLGASLQGLGDRKGAIAAYERYVELEKAPEKARFVEQARGELSRLDPSRFTAPKPTVAVTPPPPVTPPPVTPPPPVKPTVAVTAPRADSAMLRAAAAELQKAGKLDEAAVAYSKAIDADPANPDLYKELGECYFGQKKYTEAASAFGKAVERDPKRALDWYSLAEALRKTDKKSDAVKAFRQYIQLKPEDPDPYYGLGQTLKSIGDVPGAIDAFRKYTTMEKRTEKQRWVDKAKTELEVLETMKSPSGELHRGSLRGKHNPEFDRIDNDGLLDPFTGDTRSASADLKDPFGPDSTDPFARPATPPSVIGTDAKMREYSQAIEAYRRALSRYAEDVAQKHERGVAFALMSRRDQATRAFDVVPLEDPAVNAARRTVERVRKMR